MVGARTADDMVECARPTPLQGNLSSIVFEPRQLQLPEERAPHVLAQQCVADAAAHVEPAHLLEHCDALEKKLRQRIV